MTGSNDEMSVKTAPDHDMTQTSPDVVTEEPVCKKVRSTRWARGVLSASTSAMSGRGDEPPKLTEVVICAIDRQLAIHFPELPRPPTVEFHSMLQHIFQNGLSLGDGFRLAEEHRLRGETWPK